MTCRAAAFFSLCFAVACSGTIEPGESNGPSGPGGDGDGTAGEAGRAGNDPSTAGDGDGDGDGPAAGEVAFACDEGAVGEQASLRRLTMTQYANTVRELIAQFAPNEADAIASALTGSLGALPIDQREATPEDLHGSYRRLDQSLQQTHVDAIYALSTATAAQLTTPARLAEVAGDCAVDTDASNDETCLNEFIARFGERALRRPLDDADLDFYRTVYGSDAQADPAGYADVIAVMLNAPELVYFVEHGDQEIAEQPGTFELSAHELAARLSYQVWQGPPDDALMGAAEDGSLLDPEVLAEHVDRMLDDPRARGALDEFFADWMKVEDLPPLDAKNADPVFAAFAGDDLPGPELRQAMIDDVLALLRYYTWEEPAGIDTLLTTELSFAQHEALAEIYDVPVWDGESEPPGFPAGERPGLLTRALFLATGSPNTRPIMKGVFLRKHVLCDDIPPPPPGANAMPPELRDDMTTREVVEELTETPGTVCAGCHATLINPLGFATESFDALGRSREEQRLFSDEGEEVGALPVDSSGVPRITSGDETAVMGAAELMSLIAESGKAEACLARSFFRFTHARFEDLERDGCALEAMRAVLAAGGDMTELVRAAVQTEVFRRRSFEGDEP